MLARLAGGAEEASGAGPADELTRLCGYLPLAIEMLARQLRHHPAWTVPSMAAELAAARDRLAMMHAENLLVAAAFDLSYRDLAATQQRLFRRAGLIPGPGFDAYAVAALDDTSLATARRGLDELYDHHLLAEPAPGRYQLHDLLREHARALAAPVMWGALRAGASGSGSSEHGIQVERTPGARQLPAVWRPFCPVPATPGCGPGCRAAVSMASSR